MPGMDKNSDLEIFSVVYSVSAAQLEINKGKILEEDI